MDSSQYPALNAELQGAEYTGTTDQQAADLLNTLGFKESTRPRTLIPSYEVINATNSAEWAALNAQEKQRYQLLVSAGTIDVSAANTRNAFSAMFTAGSATRAALLALLSEPATRGEALGFGRVEYWDVARARTL